MVRIAVYFVNKPTFHQYALGCRFLSFPVVGVGGQGANKFTWKLYFREFWRDVANKTTEAAGALLEPALYLFSRVCVSDVCGLKLPL